MFLGRDDAVVWWDADKRIKFSTIFCIVFSSLAHDVNLVVHYLQMEICISCIDLIFSEIKCLDRRGRSLGGSFWRCFRFCLWKNDKQT